MLQIQVNKLTMRSLRKIKHTCVSWGPEVSKALQSFACGKLKINVFNLYKAYMFNYIVSPSGRGI